MSSSSCLLSPEQRAHLLARYRDRRFPALSRGTVKDYCDSADNVPLLSSLQGDLKDLQRPAALKFILGLCSPGSRLLEIGAGEPFVGKMLVELGYDVTVVDPYDGSGRGPTEFESFTAQYAGVKFVRSPFLDGCLPDGDDFDCIYSISVLEHVSRPSLERLYAGIRQYLRPNGISLHIVDCVLEGVGADFHLEQLAHILRYQSELGADSIEALILQFQQLLTDVSRDLDTYFLSAEGHNRWRGNTTYEDFPFRRVFSTQFCQQRAAFLNNAGAWRASSRPSK